MKILPRYLAAIFWLSNFTLASSAHAQLTDTLPALKDGQAPQNFHEMWDGFDPRAEPLETEVLQQWEEPGVTLKIVRFRIGVFKGKKATLAAVYGFPNSSGKASGNENAQREKVPGLVQIHGGGQYADYKACLANAKRGYATVSIAWAGRISAPKYRVTPAEVRLFWDGKTDDPNYRITTDWGAVDGYHAPGRNPGNVFPSAKSAEFTLDTVESPRNSGWFLCAIAARRALTFLEQQPEVDANRLGVYGHSMGGKLTVMSSVDPRVKAAAPSCGGISDRYNNSQLFCKTIGDDVSLKQIKCPIVFLSPANDFHGRIGNQAAAIQEIQSDDWRVTCSPHHNHQDTEDYEVATLLWFDHHLRGTFQMPKTPDTSLNLKTKTGTPEFLIRPDTAQPVLEVDVYYTQQGKPDETQKNLPAIIHRYWHHVAAKKSNGQWKAALPLATTDKPLWVFANVRYPLPKPVSGVGYYYGDYTAETFNLSSLLNTIGPQKLSDAGAKATLEPSLLIEDFSDDWQKEWFAYRDPKWARTTNKLNSPLWKAPPGARLSFRVKAAQKNTLIVRLDDHVAEIEVGQSPDWQDVSLSLSNFKDYSEQPLADWTKIRSLKFSASEHLRPGRGKTGNPRRIGRTWNGKAPGFADLRWVK